MPYLKLMNAGLLAVALSGCTFFNQGNPRIPVAVQMPEGMPAGDAGAARRVAVAIPFEDGRSDREFCGMQKITYGVTPGRIVCTAPPAAELARLLAERLRALGYAVSPASASTPPTVLKISGDLRQFFVEPVRIGGDSEADIHVRLRASSGTGLEAERDFYEKGRGSDYQRSVNNGVRKLLTAMADAIAQLLDAQPTVGRPARDPSGQSTDSD